MLMANIFPFHTVPPAQLPEPESSPEYNTMLTISEKLLAECRSETADIEVVRGYLEQENCDVNIRDNHWVCNMVHGYTCEVYGSVFVCVCAIIASSSFMLCSFDTSTDASAPAVLSFV